MRTSPDMRSAGEMIEDLMSDMEVLMIEDDEYEKTYLKIAYENMKKHCDPDYQIIL